MLNQYLGTGLIKKKNIQPVKLVHFHLCCEIHLDGSHSRVSVLLERANLFSNPSLHSLIITDLPQSCRCFSPYWHFPCFKLRWCSSSHHDAPRSHAVWYRWTAALGPCQLLSTFVTLMFYFILYPCLALSSSSHSACAIQRYHILPVTRRLHLLCPRAPPPSLLSLWQPRAAQSPHRMPTRRAGILGADCGPRTASAVPCTAPWTAWTALKQSQWPWSQQQARGTCLWAATPPSRRATRQCWCPRPRSTWKPHVPLLGYR